MKIGNKFSSFLSIFQFTDNGRKNVVQRMGARKARSEIEKEVNKMLASEREKKLNKS
jgi:hypothetical protein